MTTPTTPRPKNEQDDVVLLSEEQKPNVLRIALYAVSAALMLGALGVCLGGAYVLLDRNANESFDAARTLPSEEGAEVAEVEPSEDEAAPTAAEPATDATPVKRSSSPARSTTPARKAKPAVALDDLDLGMDFELEELEELEILQLQGDTAEPSEEGKSLRSELTEMSHRASRGELSGVEKERLGAISSTEPVYTRATTLLYQDAKARRATTERKTLLAKLMRLPENQYNPQLIVEQAYLAVEARDYDSALERANRAELHWARLPSEILFSRKSMIFEIQAVAWQGLFYKSGGEDLDALHHAIRSWEKFRRHAETKSRNDMTAKAGKQLAKLQDMQRRLE